MVFIEKHHIEIKCSKQDTAKHLKDEVGAVFEQHLYPKLEDMFKRYDVSESVWCIEQLQVEVPTLLLSNWKHDLVNTIVYQVEDYIKRHYPKTEAPKGQHEPQMGNVISKQKTYQNLLIAYLFKGTLSSNSITNQLQDVIEHVVIDADFVTVFEAKLRENHEQLRAMVLRLVLNIPEALTRDLAEALDVLSAYRTLQTMMKKQSKSQGYFGRFLFWKILFKTKNSSQITKTDVNHVVQTAGAYFEMTSTQVLDSINFWQNTIANSDSMKSAQLHLFTGGIATIRSHINTTDINVSATKNNTEALPKKNDIEAILQAIQGTSTNEKTIKTSTYHYINNAGLVILHPYLSMLFQKLNYTEEFQWKKPHFQHRAVLLTQYLICGNTKIFESDLLLNKIFCGVPMADTVCTEWEISKEEKEQCQKLLEAVIGYWDVLKNTSIEALQETFLQRDAKLITFKGETHELIVEQKGVDILLEQLPWGIGILKTHWMADYLTCQWI